MRRIGFAAVALLFAVFLFTGIASVRSQSSSPLDYVNSLWIAHSEGILKIATADGTVLLEIDELWDVRALAVDERQGVVWGYGQGSLRAYGFDGQLLLSTEIPIVQSDDGNDDGDTENSALSVDSIDGSVWLGLRKTLLHFNAQGWLLSTLSLPAQVRALSSDEAGGRLWVATAKSVQAYDEAMDLASVLDLGKNARVQDIDFDPGSQALWVALQDSVRLYEATGELVFETRVDQPQRIASDGQGWAWLATKKRLVQLDSSGTVLSELEPFRGQGKLVALVADRSELSAWVASKKEVASVGAGGELEEPLELWDGIHIRDLAFYADLFPPEILFLSPAAGAWVNTAAPAIELEYSDIGSGVSPSTLFLRAGGEELSASCTSGPTSATCVPTIPLPEGANTLTATIRDHAGNASEPAEVTFTVDTVPPQITLLRPEDGSVTNQAAQSFEGHLSEPADLSINGEPVSLGPDQEFSYGPVWLQEGVNDFELQAIDRAGNMGELSVGVTLDTMAPEPVDPSLVQLSELSAELVEVSAPAGSVEPGTMVTISNERTGEAVTAPVPPDGSFVASIGAQSGDLLLLIVTDLAGNSSEPTSVEVGSGFPPNPAAVAPALDPTVATSLLSATEFLYSGSQPLQFDVPPGVIDPRRVAVVRGVVRDRNGAPLPGVTISIHSHPEFGTTLSRRDGAFDMAVNGGGLLTVNYVKVDYFPVQRQITVPWRDYVWVEDVVMTTVDAKVSVIDLSQPDSFQVARGSVVTDEDGTRQATLLFPSGTQATLEFADGSTEAIDVLSVRVTEYTVGPNGPAAMPAKLPANVAYTYAVEFSADEAEAAGAEQVNFDRPLISYTENFLGFPVGEILPLGAYDRDQVAWLPLPNGLVVQILSIDEGVAELDVDGSGMAADAETLASLGITEAEREQLALLYEPGQSLWRVLIPHFSTPYDTNLCYGCETETAGCTAPQLSDTKAVPPMDDSCWVPNRSVIECQNQILGEATDLAGTPLRLHYQSNRVFGWAAARTLKITLSGETLPTGVIGIALESFVAGQRFTQSLPAEPNAATTFTWDGKDAYGRTVQGAQPILIRIGYVYQATYMSAASLYSSFGYNGNGTLITGSPTRETVTFWQEVRTEIGTLDHQAQGLGGWSLSEQHAYDPRGRVLYFGNGRRRSERGSARVLGRVIETVAGTGVAGHSGDGGPATGAKLNSPRGVAVGADGSLYIADSGNHRIRRVYPDGHITTVAGTGVAGYRGNGGPATSARLRSPHAVALGPDGSLYIGDSANHRVRRVGLDGIIRNVAGNGSLGSTASGDGGPATSARVAYPNGVAVGPDRSIYISSPNHARVRRVDPNGIISTLAGTGVSGSGGNGGPASKAHLRIPHGVALGSNGSLYIVERDNHDVRRVGPDGIIRKVAGITRQAGYSGDGGAATGAKLRSPRGVATGPDGSFYIGDRSNNRVRKVGTDGKILTVAGTGSYGYAGDGGLGTVAKLRYPRGVAVGPDGSLYIADTWNHRIRRLRPALPSFSDSEIVIPSEDASEVYVFTNQGRHLLTLDALTGALVFEFAYDSEGRLSSVEDDDGNITVIDRDEDGAPRAIIGPFGQRTELSLEANGYLYSVEDAGGQRYEFAYHSEEGLLATFTDPRGGDTNFEYDAMGRLTEETDAVDATLTLDRIKHESGYTVALRTAEGRVTTYEVEELATEGQRRLNTVPSGQQSETWIDQSGNRTIMTADGTAMAVELGPDPRFGMLAPLPSSVTVITPGGLALSVEIQRAVTLSDPTDPLSLSSQTDILTVNGRSYASHFDAAARTVTKTSPEGRQSTKVLDEKGRVVEVEVPELAPAHFSYDDRGRLAAVSQTSGDETRDIGLSYNSSGYVETFTDALRRTWEFAYDDEGRVTAAVRPDGQKVEYGYDENGNLTSITPPGRPKHEFSYTPVDLEEEYAPPYLPDTGTTVTATDYNLDRQLDDVLRPDGKTLDLEYDSAGRLSVVSMPRGQISYTYDPDTGHLDTITAPDGGTLGYTYDGSLPLSTTWSGTVSGSVQLKFNNELRLVEQKVNGTSPVTLGYDRDNLLTQAGNLTLHRDARNGRVTGITMGGVTDAIEYNSFGEVTRYVAQFGGTELYAVEYQRDKLGRITQKTETIEGTTTIHEYGYDLASRLVDVWTDGVKTAHYEYDLNGNRLSKQTLLGTISATYDDQDRLLTYGDLEFTYNEAGDLETKTNTATGEVTTYSYDVFGNLRQVVLPDGKLVEHVIDGQNRRIGKKVDGQLVQGWLYGSQLGIVAELDDQGDIVSRFVLGGMVKGGTEYRILRDHLSSPRLVIDAATGQVVQKMRHDEWGELLEDSNPGFQPEGFASGLWDADTGLVRFGARDYLPNVGRWLLKDAILFHGGDTNLYAYVASDPVNYSDPSGLYIPLGPYVRDVILAMATLHQQVSSQCKAYFTKLGYPLESIFIFGTEPEINTAGHSYFVKDPYASAISEWWGPPPSRIYHRPSMFEYDPQTGRLPHSCCSLAREILHEYNHIARKDLGNEPNLHKDEDWREFKEACPDTLPCDKKPQAQQYRFPWHRR